MPVLTPLGVLGSIPPQDGFDVDSHYTNVFSCNHNYVMHAEDARLADVLLMVIAILHRKYQTTLECEQIHFID